MPSTIHNVLLAIYKFKDDPHFISRFNAPIFAQQLMFVPLLNTIWALYFMIPGNKAANEYFVLSYMCYSA